MIPSDDDHHIPSQLWNNTISLHNDIFEYHSSLLMSQTVIVIDNHSSGLHLLQRSWMLLLLINLRSSSWSSSFCKSSAVGLDALHCKQCQFCCRCRKHCIASNARRSLTTRQSSTIRQSSSTIPDASIYWCWSNTAPRLHTFLIYVHCFVVWPFAHCTVQWLRLHSHCTVAMLADQQWLRKTFWHSFDCIVVF